MNLESWEFGNPQDIIDRIREKKEQQRKKKARRIKFLTKKAKNKASNPYQERQECGQK